MYGVLILGALHTLKKRERMKLFLDTSNLESIKKYQALGILNGVTTNPSNLSKEGGDVAQKVKEIARAFPHGDISIEVTETDPEKVYDQAKKIAALAQNVTVKIPCHVQYYAVIEKLVQENISLNITLVFTLVQSLMMCKLGVTYISPFIGRWEDIDIEGSRLLHEVRHMVDTYDYKTQILAASLRTVRNFHDAIISGADVATVSPELLEKALYHPLTESGIKKFYSDWQKLGSPEFP